LGSIRNRAECRGSARRGQAVADRRRLLKASRQLRGEWRGCGWVSSGIDPIQRHGKFFSKYDLPFPLLSDEDRGIVETHGVWVEKKLYGKTYMGTERTNFIIGPDGRIKAVLSKVKPDAHPAQVMQLL